MDKVIFKKENKSGHIILSRPEKINSLTYEMLKAIDEKLEEWKQDKEVSFIIIYGKGPRGFCAGGDMTVFYDEKEKAIEIAKEFFSLEYALDLKIINYSKPIIALLDGIVMGGGVGLSYGANYRLVTEATKWAMPEVNIGFFADVGASFFLSRIPKEMARFISLTGKVLSAEDVLYLGYAEEKIYQSDIKNILKDFSDIVDEDIEKQIKIIIEKYKKPRELSFLEKNKKKIKDYFLKDSMGEIIFSLEKGIEEGDNWAYEIFKNMRKKSLLSQYIILEQLKRSKNLTIEECFEQEYILSINFMGNPDFQEGLRSVLIDKDEPNWKYKESEDISAELVNSYFIKKRP